MKTLFIIILSLFTTQLVSQTNLDSLLFNKVNDYRILNGLDKIMWDNDIYKAANHHSTYLTLLNSSPEKAIISHIEKIDFNDFEELYGLYERYGKYVSRQTKYIAENVTGTKVFEKNFYSDEKIADITFSKWKSSSKHNSIMLSPKTKYGACSTIVVISEREFILENGIRKISMQRSFSTLDFSS